MLGRWYLAFSPPPSVKNERLFRFGLEDSSSGNPLDFYGMVPKQGTLAQSDVKQIQKHVEELDVHSKEMSGSTSTTRSASIVVMVLD